MPKGCPWAGEDKTICIGEKALLGCEEATGSENYSYEWLPKEGLRTTHAPFAEAGPDKTTTYTLYVKDGNGNLIARDEVIVTVLAPISATITPEYTKVCPGTPVTFAVVAEGDTDNLTYLWDNRETTPEITIAPPAAKYVFVEVFHPGTGCRVKAESLLNLEITPYIDIISTADTICELAGLGRIDNNQESGPRNLPEGCEQTSAWLYAGTGFPGYSYLWSTGDVGDDITVEAAGVYTVTVTNSKNECLKVVSREVKSCTEVFITLGSSEHGSYLNAGEGYVSYLWHDGSTGRTITFDKPGLYAVTVVDRNGCRARGTFNSEN